MHRGAIDWSAIAQRSADGAELLAPSSMNSSGPTLAGISVYSAAAGFYVACLKAGYVDEAQEFAEWFLDEFDLDLET